jgi:lipoprotein NlpD
LAGLWLAGCASVPDGFYKIAPGDTLSEIAARNRVSTRTLARWNGLSPPYTIYAGRLLRVEPPDGAPVSAGRSAGRGVASTSRAKPARGSTAGARTKPAPRTSAPAPRADAGPAVPGSRRTASGVDWAWPLTGPIEQTFRTGDRTRQGLRIGCRPGEPVRASAGGKVVYSGSGLKGYGNLIIVRHNDKYLSAYGFNRRLLAGEGDSVKRGQTVGECGQGPGGTHLLHFEVRRHGAAVDPILYLPPR